MRLATTLLSLVVVLAWSSAAAQDPSAIMRDPELLNYRLSMETLRKLVPAQRALNALAAKEPEVFEAINRENDAGSEKTGALPTAAEAAATLERHSRVRSVINDAGLVARDWLLAPLAMGNTLMVLEINRAELGSDYQSPPGTAAQKANLALVEKNEAECARIDEELERLTKEPAWAATQW